MQINNKKKICVVVSSLAYGGAERSSALITKMLFELGHEVHVVSVLPHIDFKFYGTLLNLGDLKNKDASWLGRFKRFKVFKSYLKKHQFDFIVDNRTRPSWLKEMIISHFLYKKHKCIYCVRSYKIENYIVRPRWLARIIYKNAYAIISNSRAIHNRLEDEYGLKNVITIYNAVELIPKSNNLRGGDYILFMGRINNEVKNITLLINSYKISDLANQGVKLKILGYGSDLAKMKELVSNLSLEKNIDFIDYDPSPEEYIKNAIFTVLTSRYEGFPRVLLESLSLGTPVISVNYDSGVEEIIKHEFNGLIVENNSASKLAKAMERFINNEELYLTCKNNSQESIEKFSLENIAHQWQQLLK